MENGETFSVYTGIDIFKFPIKLSVCVCIDGDALVIFDTF